jgi:hypothetical protein
MRKALTGWIVVAASLVVLGTGTFVRAQATRGLEVPPGMVEEWRKYATEVERGTRTPLPVTTRMLTETAIAQSAYAAAAMDLLRLVGGGVALLGLLLTLDLVRVRARQNPDA